MFIDTLSYLHNFMYVSVHMLMHKSTHTYRGPNYNQNKYKGY